MTQKVAMTFKSNDSQAESMALVIVEAEAHAITGRVSTPSTNLLGESGQSESV